MLLTGIRIFDVQKLNFFKKKREVTQMVEYGNTLASSARV